MATLLVSYPGKAHTRFDRDYYVRMHLPLVMEAWKPYGLRTLAAFFPVGDGAGTIALCVCEFQDEQAIQDSFASPQAERVMADIPHFTDAKPNQSRSMPL